MPERRERQGRGKGPLERLLDRFGRGLVLGPPRRQPRERGATEEPGERSGIPLPQRALAYVMAVVLPVAVAAAMIPLRAEHGRTTAIVLVVPVVAIALLGATGPAIVAALSAGLAYDVLLTEPYYRLIIDDPDDAVAAFTLVAVGMTVGVLSSRLVRLTARAAARRTELDHLVQFVRATTATVATAELAESACTHIAAVLGLQECRWAPGYHGTSAPVLLPDGNVMGSLSALNPDRAMLPRHLELPAVTGALELGRFILTAADDHVASHEERLTAVTIASLFASTVGSGTGSGADGS